MGWQSDRFRGQGYNPWCSYGNLFQFAGAVGREPASKGCVVLAPLRLA